VVEGCVSDETEEEQMIIQAFAMLSGAMTVSLFIHWFLIELGIDA
jgi:hypothetical protein